MGWVGGETTRRGCNWSGGGLNWAGRVWMGLAEGGRLGGLVGRLDPLAAGCRMLFYT